jgi:hypothetical protein
MNHSVPVIALLGISLGVYFILRGKGGQTEHQPDPIERWEVEGGAVPVAPNRTAAQTAPHETP